MEKVRIRCKINGFRYRADCNTVMELQAVQVAINDWLESKISEANRNSGANKTKKDGIK